jgi:hypothetical protein
LLYLTIEATTTHVLLPRIPSPPTEKVTALIGTSVSLHEHHRHK